jgi:hypothetical protein
MPCGALQPMLLEKPAWSTKLKDVEMSATPIATMSSPVAAASRRSCFLTLRNDG